MEIIRLIWEIITSGSNANLNRVTASFFKGDGSAITGVISSSYSVSSSWSPQRAESDPIFVSKSGSYATTGSNTFVGNQIISGSITAWAISGSISGSFSGNGSGLTNILSASYSISSSTASTSSFNTSIFSRGVTYFVSGGLSSTPEAFTIWRTPYPCRVVSVMGWTDKASCYINARKSGSSGWSAHTTSFQMQANNDWTSANSVVNTDYSVNETLQIMITGSRGGESRVSVQVNFIRI